MYSSIGRKSKQSLGAVGAGGLDKKQGACLALLHTKQAFSLPTQELGARKAFTVYVTLQPTIAQMQGVCEKKNRQLKPKGRMLLLPSCICGWCPCLLRWGASDCLFALGPPPHTYPPTFSWAHDPHLDRWFTDSLPMASFSCSRGMVGALGAAVVKRQLKDSDTQVTHTYQ